MKNDGQQKWNETQVAKSAVKNVSESAYPAHCLTDIRVEFDHVGWDVSLLKRAPEVHSGLDLRHGVG